MRKGTGLVVAFSVCVVFFFFFNHMQVVVGSQHRVNCALKVTVPVKLKK